MSMTRVPLIVSSLFLAIGIGAAGFFLGQGVSGRNAVRRNISVKGLSEKEVPASFVIWNLNYSTTGNTLAEINTQLNQNTQTVVEFLKKQGFDEKEIAVQPPSLHDLTLNRRDKDTPPPPVRFNANQSVLLRTSKVGQIKPARAASSTLMASGVQLGGSNPNFIFDRLNDIKPGMIQEATKNARIAADQFARDSYAELGKLRNASQGWFQIEDRDNATPEQKVVRVVVEVQYDVK